MTAHRLALVVGVDSLVDGAVDMSATMVVHVDDLFIHIPTATSNN